MLMRFAGCYGSCYGSYTNYFSYYSSPPMVHYGYGMPMKAIPPVAHAWFAAAGLGAAAQFETPLTYRQEALRITFLTAHKARDAEAVDWSVLTDTRMTVVVYMGMTAAPTRYVPAAVPAVQENSVESP
jgi:hypothetical protein